MKKDNYFEERDEQNIQKFRAVRDMLPKFCVEFFLGIENITTPLTRLNYAYDLRIFFDFLCRKKFKTTLSSELILDDLEALTQTDLELFLEYLTSYEYDGKHYKCSASAKERKLCSIRTLCKYFYNKDKLSRNIAAKVAMPKKHDKEIVRLEVDEVAKMLNNAESGEGLSDRQKAYAKTTNIRDLALLTLLLGTGIRVSECVGLNTTDIDFETGGFVVTRKGGNRVILYFSDEVSQALKNYISHREKMLLEFAKNKDDNERKKILSNTALFISSHDGSRLSVRAVQMLVKKYSNTVTNLKKISPHKLRSTYGTNLYHETQDIYVVADVLGHKDVNTTKKHYAAISDDIRRSAANKVKLRESDDN